MNDKLNTHNIFDKCLKRQPDLEYNSCLLLAEYTNCQNCPEYSLTGRSLFERHVPNEFPDEWKLLLTAVKESTEKKDLSVVIFRVGNEWHSLKTEFFVNITPYKCFHFIPHKTNKFFKGIANINGELQLCFSGSDVLETEPSENESKQTKMILLQNELNKYIFIVDEVLGLVNLANESIRKVPITVAKSGYSLCSGIFEFKDKKIGLIDENKFFQAIEASLEG